MVIFRYDVHSPFCSAVRTLAMVASASASSFALAQACVTATAVVQTGFGVPAIACQMLTQREFLARQGWDPGP